jgi:putative MATE family efflux protein
MPFLEPAISKRIIQLSYPVMLAMLSQTLINQVDHILVGHLPMSESTPGQTAVQISQILLWMFGGFLSSITVGTQALTARRIGAGDTEGAGAVSINSLLLAVSASVVMTGVCYIGTPVLFRLFNKDPAVLELGVPFLRWRFLQMLGMVSTASLKAFFDGMGRTHVHMGAAIVMNIANFLLCVALMFGNTAPGIQGIDAMHRALLGIFGDLPKLGVPGAGLASMLSSYVGLVLMFAWSLRAEFRPYHMRRLRSASGSMMWSIVRLSFPSGVATMFAMVGFGFVLYVVGKLDKLAGYGVGRTINATATSNIINVLMLVFISCIAYGTATATLVSQNMGAKATDMAERFAFGAAKLGVLIFAAIGLCISIWAEPILHFWNPDPEVVAAALPILRVLGLLTPVIAVALVFTQALYGAGDTFFVMVVELTLHTICLMPLSYLLGVTFGLGLWGVWGAMIFYLFALAAAMAIKFSRGSWKHISI